MNEPQQQTPNTGGPPVLREDTGGPPVLREDTGGPPVLREGRRYHWLRWGFMFGAVVLAVYLAGPWILPRLGEFLDVSEPPRRVDCVLVLGGGASTRPFVAAALIRAGLARRALIATVKLSPEARDGTWPAEHDLVHGVLLARKVRGDEIVLLPGECDSTIDEARALARFLDSEPEATVAVVTNDFHTRRARMLFRRVLGPRQSQVHFVSAPVDGVVASNWWRTEKGFVVYTTEYLKLILYGFR
jgi:uncharacterized SAM-binding protein YcdF (DUF218 family)